MLSPEEACETVLFKGLYLCSCGPLVLVIYSFRNSLVFHSVDKVTSLFVHVSPMLCVYIIRWRMMDIGEIDYLREMKMDLGDVGANGGRLLSESSSQNHSGQTPYRIKTIPHITSNEVPNYEGLPPYFQERFVNAHMSCYNWNFVRDEPFSFIISHSIGISDLRFGALFYIAHQVLYLTVTCIFPVPDGETYTWEWVNKMQNFDKKFAKYIPSFLGGKSPFMQEYVYFRIVSLVLLCMQMMPAMFLYNDESGWGITLYAFFFVVIATNNGATFYTDVFSIKYANEVTKRASRVMKERGMLEVAKSVLG